MRIEELFIKIFAVVGHSWQYGCYCEKVDVSYRRIIWCVGVEFNAWGGRLVDFGRQESLQHADWNILSSTKCKVCVLSYAEIMSPCCFIKNAVHVYAVSTYLYNNIMQFSQFKLEPIGVCQRKLIYKNKRSLLIIFHEVVAKQVASTVSDCELMLLLVNFVINISMSPYSESVL